MTSKRGVFISHTTDLGVRNARAFVQAARDAVAGAGLEIVEQLDFVASDEGPREGLSRLLSECGVYVAIVGHLYGTESSGDLTGRSYVEFEYDTASELGLERLIFLLDDATAPELKGAQKDERQERFRQQLKDTQMCKAVARPEELRSAVGASLGKPRVPRYREGLPPGFV